MTLSEINMRCSRTQEVHDKVMVQWNEQGEKERRYGVEAWNMVFVVARRGWW